MTVEQAARGRRWRGRRTRISKLDRGTDQDWAETDIGADSPLWLRILHNLENCNFDFTVRSEANFVQQPWLKLVYIFPYHVPAITEILLKSRSAAVMLQLEFEVDTLILEFASASPKTFFPGEYKINIL